MKEYTGPNSLLKAFQLIRQALKNAVPSAGDGIDITETEAGASIGVTTPVRSIVTQAEYDALPEAERNKGLYVISDGDEGGGGGGGGSEEVYSTEETRIGTWIDGKPIYRKVYVLNSGQNGEHMIDVPGFDVSQIDTMVRMNAIIKGIQSSGTWVQDGWNFSASNLLNFQISEGHMRIAHSPAFYANRPLWVILEYTKTTDTGGTT